MHSPLSWPVFSASNLRAQAVVNLCVSSRNQIDFIAVTNSTDAEILYSLKFPDSFVDHHV